VAGQVTVGAGAYWILLPGFRNAGIAALCIAEVEANFVHLNLGGPPLPPALRSLARGEAPPMGASGGIAM